MAWGMILLISCLNEAKACTEPLQQATNQPVEWCSDLQAACARLTTEEFSAVILDQFLLEAEPDRAEVIFKNLGSAVPVCVNFAITGIGRVVRELRLALERRKREVAVATQDAQQALRQELNGSVSALLLSCEMALREPDLPEPAASKMHDVQALARQLSAKLGKGLALCTIWVLCGLNFGQGHSRIAALRDARYTASLTSSAISSRTSSGFSSSMKPSTSCGTGFIHTGANDCRCRGDGPCSRSAAMWCGVLYPLLEARP